MKVVDFVLKDSTVRFKFIDNSDDEQIMVDEEEYCCKFIYDLFGNDTTNIPEIHSGAELTLVNVNENTEWKVEVIGVAYEDGQLYSSSIQGVCSFRLISVSPQSDTSKPSYGLNFRRPVLF